MVSSSSDSNFFNNLSKLSFISFTLFSVSLLNAATSIALYTLYHPPSFSVLVSFSHIRRLTIFCKDLKIVVLSLSNSLARVSSETGSFLDIRTNNNSNSNGDKSYNIVKRSLIDEFILVMELTEEDGIYPNFRLL